MAIPASTSFTPLGAISPPSTSLLLPRACNPVMDLVVLFTSTHHIPSTGKGKGRAEEGQRITLWRVGGSQVWSVPYDGILAGAGWTTDGLYLSVLTVDLAVMMSGGEAGRVQLSHLSVHDGSTVLSTPLDGIDRIASPESWEALRRKNEFWDLEWTLSDSDWPVVPKGCNRMIIDQLPRPSPVEVLKPSNPLLFNLMQQQNKNKPKQPVLHASVSSFPRLFPAYSETKPQVLSIIPCAARASRRHLSGTYTVSGVQEDQTLVLAGIAHRLSNYFDTMLRGLENAEAAHKEGAKQTMIRREELETCAEQQGMSNQDVMDDVFRFLMTGRCSAAVTEWLGSRLTGRVITNWETAVDQSLKNIHQVLVESIQPALERAMLLLEEVAGLASIPGWRINENSFTDGLDKARGLAILLERIRRLTRLQAQASEEWFRWLHYEITRQSTTDPSQDQIPSPTYDVKLVWAYLKSGFTNPPLALHFPGLVDPADLSSETYTRLPPKSHDLQETMRRSLRTMTGVMGTTHPETPAHHAMSTPKVVDGSIDSSNLDITVEMDQEDTSYVSRRSSFSSTGTVEKKKTEVEQPRRIEDEPMVWAKSLVDSCRGLFASTDEGPISHDVRVRNLDPGASSSFTQRTIGDDSWIGFTDSTSLSNTSYDGSQVVWLLYAPGKDVRNALVGAFTCAPGVKCLALEFFDDSEIVLQLARDETSWLVTVRYADLGADMGQLPWGLSEEWTMGDLLPYIENTIPVKPLPIARARALDAPSRAGTDGSRPPVLAMNGREGRRVGCVMLGKDVTVFDMEEDEDGQEEEEEGGDEEGGDDEAMEI